MGSHLSSTPRAEIWTALLLGPLTKTHTTRTNTKWGLKTSSQTKGGNDDARESGAEGKKDREKPENETKIKQKVLQRLKGEFFFCFLFFWSMEKQKQKGTKTCKRDIEQDATPHNFLLKMLPSFSFFLDFSLCAHASASFKYLSASPLSI